MKKNFTILILLMYASFEVFSQNYTQSAGFRLGAGSGITYRRMFDTNISGELMLLGQNHGTVLTFIVQKHRPALLFNDLDMTFIWGVGAHIGVADRYKAYNEPYGYSNSHYYISTMQLGFDGFAALEYQVPRYPVSLSLECKPYFEFFDDHQFGLHLPVIAFGARYNF
ncbi:MAG: hypothetical protein IPH20_22050 [Bacteroidales bacterium]|nr:hypothetical protein [Bacteroidales bacterium]